MMSRDRDSKWFNYGQRIVLNTASHPFEYARVLIQIGYEPIPPRPSTTFFGKPALVLPNIFQYIKHIKSVDGFSGCFNGLVPKLTGSLISGAVTQKCAEFLRKNDPEMRDKGEEDEAEETEEQEKKRYLKCVKYEILTHAAAIIASQPFHVITIRMMAQFVGKETKYNGLISSIAEIYKQNGLFGFFSGLIPRLLGDLLTIVLTNTLSYAINHYLIEEKNLRVHVNAIISFCASSITYPFLVVSECMAVTNSGLTAGSPNHMPHYPSWISCWMDLSRRNQLKRGSSILMRYYTGPRIVVGGKLTPISPSKFAVS